MTIIISYRDDDGAFGHNEKEDGRDVVVVVVVVGSSGCSPLLSSMTFLVMAVVMEMGK